MSSMKTFVAMAAMLASSVTAEAGLFGSHKGCGASKCCDCAPSFQPDCCRPTIVRPCHRNCHNYQRTCAKPFNCCDDPCLNGGCGPVNGGCTSACNNGGACVNGGACGPNGHCCPAPCATACNNSGHCCPEPGCAAPCDDCCDGNACKIAELIYLSQTACYPRQRKAAIHRLGDKYSCVCNPEIMSAFVYALNDADPGVRAKAADEIGDQLRKNPCCCSPCIVNALTYALADCDRSVRRQSEQALKACGYDIVDACCDPCCDVACSTTGCTHGGSYAPAPVPAQQPQAAPVQDGNGNAPVPAASIEGGRAYYPKRLPEQKSRPASGLESLKNLFSMAN